MFSTEFEFPMGMLARLFKNKTTTTKNKHCTITKKREMLQVGLFVKTLARQLFQRKHWSIINNNLLYINEMRVCKISNKRCYNVKYWQYRFATHLIIL